MLNIDRFLKQNGLNKTQLAKKAGMRQANLYAVLRNPTFASIKKLADALNVSSAELLEGQDVTLGRRSKYARVKLNGIIVCGKNHYEVSSLRELENLCKHLKQVENQESKE